MVIRRSKMLYIVGLGLADEKDISVKGLEVVRKADRVYLEAYTAILLVNKERLVSKLCNEALTRTKPMTCHAVGKLLWSFGSPCRPRDGRVPIRRDLTRRRH